MYKNIVCSHCDDVTRWFVDCGLNPQVWHLQRHHLGLLGARRDEKRYLDKRVVATCQSQANHKAFKAHSAILPSSILL